MFCVYEQGCESYMFKAHSLREITLKTGLYVGNVARLAKTVNNPSPSQSLWIFTDDRRGQIIRSAYMYYITCLELANNDLPAGIETPVDMTRKIISGGNYD